MSEQKVKKVWVELLTEHTHKGTLYAATEKLELRDDQAKHLKAEKVAKDTTAPEQEPQA